MMSPRRPFPARTSAAYTIEHTSPNPGRGSRANRPAGSPCPNAHRKFDFTRPPGKNSRSTASLSEPDIGPVSSPSARAAMIK